MNVSELARRLRVTPQELLAKLPELGFDIGVRAIKVDDRMADQIYRKWIEVARRERWREQFVHSVASATTEHAVKKQVNLPAIMTVREFATFLGSPITRVIQQLMKAGILASQNERIDYTTAAIIAEELGFSVQPLSDKALEEIVEESTNKIKQSIEQSTSRLVARPPIIVVMGHVDHGKTRTLDAIRQTHVMEGESGGITQHIGAYQVEVQDKQRKLTFIDTPGHEAFTVMRSRGARVADIAVLVVAAEDGVQPQTKEAYQIIQAAKLPFVVALNKIDKPDADPNRVMGQLAEIGITVEEWGGKIPMVKISAKTGQGIKELLDLILFVADTKQERIVANRETRAIGTVIESHVDKGEGPVATIIVQNGTLHVNDWLGINSAAFGRVRSLKNWLGSFVHEASPGEPVRIVGLKTAPLVGDIIEVPEDPKKLEVKRVKKVTQSMDGMKAQAPVTAEEETEKKIMLNVVLKTDVFGSLEAILGMLEKIQHELIGVRVIHKGLGNVTEGDLERAVNAPPSIIYGFNVVMPIQVEGMARDKNVDVHLSKVIYELFDDVVKRLNRLFPQETIVTPIGQMEVVAVFRNETGLMIIGAKVKQGKLQQGCKIHVWRGDDPVGEGEIESIQIARTPMKEVTVGQECGLRFRGKVKLLVGDRLEAYLEESKTQRIDPRKFV